MIPAPDPIVFAVSATVGFVIGIALGSYTSYRGIRGESDDALKEELITRQVHRDIRKLHTDKVNKLCKEPGDAVDGKF